MTEAYHRICHPFSPKRASHSDSEPGIWQPTKWEMPKEPLPMPAIKTPQKSLNPSRNLKIPELEHAKGAALGTLVSLHSRRAYKNAIDRFIGWYCAEPRLGFNCVVVFRYRSFLE
jgi:hypothetical protein